MEESSREEGAVDVEGKICDSDDPRVVNKDSEDKNSFDKAEERLDELEGKLEEKESEVCVMHEEDEEIEGKIHDTLRNHVRFWRESGASDFAVSVILNGYVPQLQFSPERYSEGTNKS